MSRIVAVIPARYASTRFPGKSLTPICGKPLIQWVYERAALAKSLSSVLVATDDKRIRNAVEAFGGKAVMTLEEHPSGTDRVAEAVEKLDADIVVNIQGDEPLIEPQLIDDIGIVLQADSSWDMATAASPIVHPIDLMNPAVVKVVWGRDGRALYFSRAPIPYVRDGDATGREPAHWRHIGIYGYRRPFLQKLVAEPPCPLEELEKLEQLRALHIGCSMKVVPTAHHALGVDVPDDVPKAEDALRRAGLA
jgi:3-deoxy-manno-octulosonate cytidylyltransferase (CMP-KDO synthetase)